MKNKTTRKSFIRISMVVFIGVLIASLLNLNSSSIRDYKQIVKSGELNIVTSYNNIDYYIQDDTVTGFQYELIQAILKNKGVNLNITSLTSLSEQIDGLKNGKFDILASPIVSSIENKEQINLTIPIVSNRQILVQRKDSTLIKNQLDLAKKEIYVVKDSPAIFRIQNLSNEIADTIYVKEVELYGQDALTALVAHGDINYAVCDEIVAKLEAERLQNIDTSLAIGFTQLYSWGTNKESKALLDSLNSWISIFQSTPEYEKLYTKYYH